MKGKILVTGANGQLGRCIQDRVNLAPDYEFLFTDYQELDISDSKAVENFFEDNPIEYCINCAAYTNVDKAETEQEKTFLINAEGVRNLAKACRGQGTLLIHISTDFVFDGTKNTPYTEIDKPNPINVYGASKLKGEKYVQEILENYFIVRTSWVYSEYGHNFVKTMLRLGTGGGEISVVNDQIGAPTYAGDLAEFLLTETVSEHLSFGLYHYSNSGEISWYDFAKAIFDLAGMTCKVLPIRTKDYPTTAKRPQYSLLDKGILTDEDRRDWRHSLKKVLNKF